MLSTAIPMGFPNWPCPHRARSVPFLANLPTARFWLSATYMFPEASIAIMLGAGGPPKEPHCLEYPNSEAGEPATLCGGGRVTVRASAIRSMNLEERTTVFERLLRSMTILHLH